MHNTARQSSTRLLFPPQELSYFDVRERDGVLTAKVSVRQLRRALRWLREVTR